MPGRHVCGYPLPNVGRRGGPTLRVVTSSDTDRQPVVYERDLPPMRTEWGGYPPLPALSPSDNWTGVEESGEELVRIDEEFFCTSAQWRRGWPGTSPHSFVRSRVADALRVARAALPSGLDLAVLDAHRSLETQRYLYERAYSGTGLPAGFVADPEHAAIVPPHTTGGALDVTITWKGVPLSLGSAPGEYIPEANLAALEDGSGTAHELRRVLYWVMSQACFCGIREEWWHYSIGDQEWAWQRGIAAAPYGPAERPTQVLG